VRFTVTSVPVEAGYCHCTRCQHRTGVAASASVSLAPGSFRIEQGADAVAHWRPADGYAKAFCRECGSALFSQHPDDPANVSVRFGAFDRDPGVRPSYRQFVAYAAAWEPIPDDGLTRYDERRPGARPA
jgi:hypothetical protein